MIHPTTFQVFKHEGLRAAINYKAERMCINHIKDCFRCPEIKTPWWYKLAAKVEWYSRPRNRK